MAPWCCKPVQGVRRQHHAVGDHTHNPCCAPWPGLLELCHSQIQVSTITAVAVAYIMHSIGCQFTRGVHSLATVCALFTAGVVGPSPGEDWSSSNCNNILYSECFTYASVHCLMRASIELFTRQQAERSTYATYAAVPPLRATDTPTSFRNGGGGLLRFNSQSN